MNRNYRWGILGAGRIAEKFATALSVAAGSELYAVASRDPQHAKDFAARHGAGRYYSDYAALAEDEQVDIVYIATPHALHHQQTMLCLHHKKAVLCEKPMSLSYRHTAEMIEAAVNNKVFLMEGLWTACMPFIEKIKALIAADVIGEPKYLAADFGFTALKDLSGRLYNKALGGGSVLDVGIYPLSLATMILGVPSVIKTISSLSETGIDEYANIVMQYASGATAHVLSAISFTTGIGATIIGTKGSINIHSPWFKATDFSLQLNDGGTEHFNFPHLSNGLEFEIMEVTGCLDRALLQSVKVPHLLTLAVSKIMDEILQQAGVIY